MVHHPMSRSSPFFAPDRPTSADSDIGVWARDAGANDKTSWIFAGRDGIQRIYFAASGERARKIISRANCRPTGSFASMRMNRMIHWDSPHELNAYRLLKSNPAVLEFSEQPCVIHYPLGGTDHRHYPDSLPKQLRPKFFGKLKPHPMRAEQMWPIEPGC